MIVIVEFLKRGFAAALMFVSTAMLATHSSAQTVNSVEDGLRQLAQTIVEKSSAAELTRIAVLPFPNADGSCSVLSTYLVDELILSLFSLPKSRIEIVERSQLEALLAEMQMGEGGLLNPATTKQLGNLSGVGALTLGTITIIGDAIRINARLVATETGKTISAAAVTVPKTQAIDALLKQPVATGLTCEKKGSSQRRTTGSSGLAEMSDEPAAEQFGLQLRILQAIRSPDNSKVTLKVSLANTTKDTIGIIWIRRVPKISDGIGNIMGLRQLVGNDQCSNGGSSDWFDSDVGRCWVNNKEIYTWIEPGKQSFATLQFQQWEDGTWSKTIDTDYVSFSGNIQIAFTGPENTGDVKTANVSLTIPRIDLAKLE